MADKLGNMTVGVSADLTGLDRGMTAASRMISAFARTARDQGQSIARSIFVTGAGMFGGVVARDVFGGVSGFLRDGVRDSVKLAANWERAGVAFEVLLGRADRAKEMMRDLRELAADTPLTLTDTVDEAKKLLAAGVSQGQIVPTLRMLSDLTMGDRALMSRASLAYAQARSAGTLQGDELRQLNELGIPVMDAIAKAMGVEKNLVKQMVSDGQVRFQDLQSAFRDLTSEGGLFYKMTERGAQTTEGQFARLEDSVEELKRTLGKAIIEESGLNEAMRDGSRFADDMHRTIDDLRPSIRFAADVTKGLAQVLGEGVRNGPLFARAFGESLRETNPRIGQFVDLVDLAVKNLKEFQADPQLVARVAVDLAEGFTVAFGGLFDVVGDGLDEVFKKHVKPITDEIRSVADVWKSIRDTAKVVTDPIKGAGAATHRALNPLDPINGEGRRQRLDDLLESFRTTTTRMRATATPDEIAARLDPFNEAVRAYNRAVRLQTQPIPLTDAERQAAKAAGVDERFRQRTERMATSQEIDSALKDAERLLDALPKVVNAELRHAAAQPTIFDRMRQKFDNLALRNIAARMDPQLGRMMLLGGAGGFDPSKMNRVEEFRVDPMSALPAGGRGQSSLPPSLEWGSKAAAEAFAELVNSRGESNPVVAAVERGTEVQREMRAELDQIRGHLAILSQPVNRQRLIY